MGLLWMILSNLCRADEAYLSLPRNVVYCTMLCTEESVGRLTDREVSDSSSDSLLRYIAREECLLCEL